MTVIKKLSAVVFFSLLAVGCVTNTTNTKPSAPKWTGSGDSCRIDSDCPIPGEPAGGPENGPMINQCVDNVCVAK